MSENGRLDLTRRLTLKTLN